jgi:hypothetical protein
LYSRVNTTKCPASGPGNVTNPRLMSQIGRVHEFVIISVFLQSSCLGSGAVRFVRLVLKNVTQNYRDFLDVILLYVQIRRIHKKKYDLC